LYSFFFNFIFVWSNKNLKFIVDLTSKLSMNRVCTQSVLHMVRNKLSSSSL